MVRRFNSSHKLFFGALTLLMTGLFCVPASAQNDRSKKQKKGKEPAYAYQTFSTTQRKEKKRGFAGSESKFQFEKPLAPVPYEKADRIFDYSKAPFFGHKRPPKKHGPGAQKMCRVCGIRH
jgi:hypothetical protein